MDDAYAKLIATMLGHTGPVSKPRAGTPSALMRAMAGRVRAGDRKAASQGALQPYGESKHAGSLGAAPGNFQGAFQDDAFQDDAYQVF